MAADTEPLEILPHLPLRAEDKAHLLILMIGRRWKKKTAEDFSPVPYAVTLLNCMLWVFYGTHMVHPKASLLSALTAPECSSN